VKKWLTVTERVLFPVIAEKSGVTAAGPLPSLTGFPIKLVHLAFSLYGQLFFVKIINPPVYFGVDQ
jgi:hypothetical protein